MCEKEECDCESGDTEIYNGPHDVLGLGKIFGAICQVLVIIVLAITCTGNIPRILELFR